MAAATYCQPSMTTTNNVFSMRRHDLDNLRTFLTGLVVVHHTANSYGAPSPSPYVSAIVGTSLPTGRLPLLYFTGFNQAFFMGVFFWISGRVSAQSLRRIDGNPARSRWEFAKSKILRLGLPSIFYALVLNPIVHLASHSAWDIQAIKKDLAVYFSNLKGIRGPVWYTANLLILDLVTALLLPQYNDKSTSEQTTQENSEKSAPVGEVTASPPAWNNIAKKYGWAVAAVTAFFLRLYYPVGRVLNPIGLQPSYAPQYPLAYVLGFASLDLEPTFTGPFSATPADVKEEGEGAEDDSSAAHRSRRGLIKASLISLGLIPLVFMPRLFGFGFSGAQGIGAGGIFGGWNPYAFLYALWNEFSFVLVGPALMSYFRHCHNTKATSVLLQPRYSYGAFFMHMLVSTVIERTIDQFLVLDNSALSVVTNSGVWKICGMSLMTAAVGMLNVMGSFATSKLMLDGLPILRRIF